MRKHVGRRAHVDAATLVLEVTAALGPCVQADEPVAAAAHHKLGAHEGLHLGARDLGHPAGRLAPRGADVRAVRPVDPGGSLAEALPVVETAR